MSKKIHMVSLGCPKNLVDSEYILGILARRGHEIVEDDGTAEVIIVNTCSFIQPAVEESIETILNLAENKKAEPDRLLIVTGCLPERYKEELAASMPEVDLFLSTSEMDRLPDFIEDGEKASFDRLILSRPGFLPSGPVPRLRSAPVYSAYLKIAEGCSNGCSFCLIPRLRGPFRSRPRRVLLEEAAALAESGVKELILVAQDTTAYGRDLGERESLARLLTELAGLEGLEWLRLMYAYPSGLSEELIEVMAGVPKVCPYLDLPLQHAAPFVLKRMRRDSLVDLLRLIERLRRAIPDLALRTTMMVGFPGETEADFELLIDFISQARFERLGVFKFSPEDGTLAAKFTDQVPQRIKENRRRKLMARQRRISREINESLVGRTMPVLVEGPSSETDLLLAGRTRGQAPEIDGLVYINKGFANPGRIKEVLITQGHDYDLVGEILDEDEPQPR